MNTSLFIVFGIFVLLLILLVMRCDTDHYSDNLSPHPNSICVEYGHANVLKHSTTTVATFNIHCVPIVGCSRGYLQKIGQYVKKVVERDQVEVLILTEVFIPSALQAIQKTLQESGQWKMTIPKFAASVRVPSGVVVAWNTDIVRRAQWNDVDHNLPPTLIPLKHMTYKRCCQMDCLSRKGALHIPLVRKEGGRVFHVIGTHLQAWEIPYLCSGVRASQFSDLGRFCISIARQFPYQSVFVGGDFNTSPESKPWGDVVAPVEHTHISSKKILDYFYIVQHDSNLPQAYVTSVSPSPSDHVAVCMDIKV